MRIRSLALRGFFSHTATEITLPDRGVVLVTGPIGSGKSALFEAVSFALWGKTLRGTDPWPAGGGSVQVSTDDGLVVTRSRKGSRTALKIERPEGPPLPSFETTTKAQAALETLVGPFDVWRRASVLVNGETAQFTLATDAERKRLLEVVLGLDRFDRAHDRAVLDQKAAQITTQSIGRDLAVARERQAGALRLVEALAATAPEVPDLASLEVATARLAAAVEGANTEAAAAALSFREASVTVARAEEALRQARAAVAAAEVSACATCGRPLDPAEVAAARQGAGEALRRCEAAAKAAEEVHAREKLYTLDISKEARELAGLLAHKRADLEQGRRRAQEARDHLGRVAAAQEAVNNLGATTAALAARAEEAARDLAIREAAIKALGIRGVRAHVLGASFAGLERIANGWLAALAGDGLRLRLGVGVPGEGAASDRVVLEVEGAGGGNGYKGASGGERRRIDLALTMALADVSAAAFAQLPGTVFFDEVFDTLDDETGTIRAARAVEALAADRCVVVISHAPAFVEEVKDATRITVRDGVVSTR